MTAATDGRSTATDAGRRIEEAAREIAGAGASAPDPARDPVNQAMINNWVEAIGDANPVYTDPAAAAASVHGELVAPPAMTQVWTMRGLHGARPDDDPLRRMTELLDEAGYTSVVATNSTQTYHRYLRPGEHVAASAVLEGVVGPKRTALGDGWFVTTRTTWYVGDEAVAEMTFRILKFRPPEPQDPGNSDDGTRTADAAPVLRPVVTRDNAFFWEGLRDGELRIQRWGGTLRHPPGPMPPDGDLEAEPDYVVAAGTGTVYSFLVHHHPPVPGKRLPFVLALVELDEGVRVLGELHDVDPDEVHIGLAVAASFDRIDDDLTLPAWTVRS
ncbi:OB-fold domain-containing protein [Prauserella halophila]|uniref:OB-fold domain-containing protein n=1 Tax=Prauserella halophila TaxID=185641 RepID=A0ABP4GHA9_9PSEU|nr:OB-fold domain-containing protein [Prauserella halophila]MCP2234329.1 putative OB-fold protein, contains Zn-ribbon domain [Prauserella halophila]